MGVFWNRKVDLSLKPRGNVRTLSKESRTIDISWESCLSSARCVEGKQHLNKDIFVPAFINLDAIPISKAYKMAGRSRTNHIALQISKDSVQDEFSNTAPVPWSYRRLGRDPCWKRSRPPPPRPRPRGAYETKISSSRAGQGSWRGKRSTQESSSFFWAWKGKPSLLNNYLIFLLIRPKLPHDVILNKSSSVHDLTLSNTFLFS